MKVTPDEYELPVAVADSASELAKMCGVTANSIRMVVLRAKRKGCGYRSIYVKIEEDDEFCNEGEERQ